MWKRWRDARRERQVEDIADIQKRVHEGLQIQHVTAPPKHQKRVEALAYAIQSFGGREVSTADVALRAESFYLFLVDEKTEEE